jgi:hypothetical protein
MAKQLHAEVEIEATPDRVWAVLTDFAAYPDWNPFIVQAAGQPIPGTRLELQMRLSGGRPTPIRPEVLEADPAHRLRWLGRLLLPGLFDGEHTFTLQPTGPDRTCLTQHEEFRGVLAPLVLTMIAKPTLASFHQMNQALKTRSERPAHNPTR